MTMLADQATEYVAREWLARRAAHSPVTRIQDGGPGNGLLADRYATHYRGSRVWTDGTTIYSYHEPLYTFSPDGAIVPCDYVLDHHYSATTARHIKHIRRVLDARA